MQTGLYDLLAPQFLIGVQMPTWLDEILSFLRLETLEEAWDDNAIVYYGKAQFVGKGIAQAPTSGTTPSGNIFQWEDVNLQFRLTVPRTRSNFIETAITTAGTAAPAGSPIADINNLMNRLEVAAVATDPSDYPGVGFQLELLFSALSIHLPKDEFLPAKISGDGWLTRDTSIDHVEITLPKIALTVTQGNTIGDLDFQFNGWGTYSLDDPADPRAGELIKMVPSLCLHESRVIGFGLEKIVADFSDRFTPPEILEQFGTGDGFEGLWIPHVRFFVASGKQTGFAFDIRANDLLIDFNQGVSGEFGFDLIHRNKALTVEPIIYQGDERRTITRGSKTTTGSATTVKNSRASVAEDGELQLSIRGGYPPHTIVVKLDGTTLASSNFNGDPNRLIWKFNSPGTGNKTLEVTVTDSSNPSYSWNETINLELTTAGVSSGSDTIYLNPTLTVINPSPGYEIKLAAVQPDINKIFLTAAPSNIDSTTVDGLAVSPAPDTAGNFSVDVTPDGTTRTVVGNWVPPIVDVDEIVYFENAVPSTSQISSSITNIQNLYGNALIALLNRAVSAGQGSNLVIEGNASYDGVWQESYNQALSDRRVQVLKQVLQNLATTNGLTISISSETGNATERARGNLLSAPNNGTLPGCGTYPHGGTMSSDYSHACYRNSMVSFPPAGSANLTVQIARPAPITIEYRTPTERGPEPNKPAKPSIFKSIGARIRLERNLLVLAELHGQLDFVTAAEDRAGLIQGTQPATNGPTNISSKIVSQSGATSDGSATPQDGIVDYKLQMSFDSATKRITYTLGLGFDKNQQDGFVHLNKFSPESLSDTFGSILTFAPLLANSIDTAVDAEGSDATAPVILAAAEIGVAVALGLTGVFKMERITLFGAELNVSQELVGNYDFDNSTFTELSALFDYAIDFKIDLDLGIIKIQSSADKPLRVRYNALGFKLDFVNGNYVPIFDTSKGYEFAMADPGLLEVSSPFGNILKVIGARVSRVNPLNVEFDLGINANLGVISVEQIKVKIPVDPLGVPTIIPTKATVDIPGTFIGSGYIDLSDGIKGSIDITIVPVKLRMMANIGINPIEADGRKVTAFFLGLGVEFPSAIPIGGSGLGLYGVLGLFGMHYKREENINTDVPALDWLNNKVHGNPTDIAGWEPNLDKWAFGVGAVLGTIDSGFTLNLKGMLLLELPGPRILILVKLQMLAVKPATQGSVATLGLLAVVDLDFNLNKLTIGVLIAYEIENLISLKIPVEAAFSFDELNKWHLYIGRISAPVSAKVLGIVKAQGYFMIDGDKIDNFPGPNGSMTLQGLAIAMGLKASVILGDESSGLYLKVTAGFDAGISFSPLHVYGVMELRGELRLFIVSISAWATLKVEAPNPTYLIGEACGKVDFFFFSIKGCVTIKIGSKPPPAPAPELLSGMLLQSRSPALVIGQGSDRSIDGSLGNAKEVSSISNAVDNSLLKVPIDSIPILKFIAPAQQSGSFTTFTDTISQAPKLTSSGWIEQGENRQVRYTLKSINISTAVELNGLSKPPTAWISNKSEAKGIDTNLDLALFSWIPEATPRAIQRSQELTEKIKQRWGDLCSKVAPEACVLWTFNYEQLGYSSTGWDLDGKMWPDPPNTDRTEEPNKTIHVFEDKGALKDPLFEQLTSYQFGSSIDAAKVIGDTVSGVDINNSGTSTNTTSLNDGTRGTTINNPKTFVGKVLELPYKYNFNIEKRGDLELLDRYKEMVQKEPQKIIIDAKGEISMARILIAVHDGTNLKTIHIRGYDDKDQQIETFTASEILEISGVHGGNLPVNWINSSGPWFAEIVGVMSYLGRKQKHLERHMLKWEPAKDVVKFDIFIEEPQRKLDRPPSLLLAAIQLCKEEERRRFTHETKVKETMIEIVESALEGGQLRPLLSPDTRYTISVSYDGEAKETDVDGNINEGTTPYTQRYTFMTDRKSPPKLNPWVLFTTPYDNNPYHFTEDKVEIYFNDSSVIQLYEKYGDQLKAVLRKANGNHDLNEPPIDMASLDDVDAEILTPFEDTLRAVMSDKDCVGIKESEKHKKFTLNIPLDRGTEYTLDVEIDGAPVPVDPTNPLFRVAFKTSRYTGAEELAEKMNEAFINHRRLEHAFTILGDEPSDREIEEALINAGLEAIAPSVNPTYWYLWKPVGNSHELEAILIDAPEPLWRKRNTPKLETVLSDTGDMQHWVFEETNYLRIEETSSVSTVEKIVHSPGGTRTIIYLKNTSKDLELSLIQRGIVLDGSTGSDTAHVILETELPTKAPWELNEITD